MELSGFLVLRILMIVNNNDYLLINKLEWDLNGEYRYCRKKVMIK